MLVDKHELIVLSNTPPMLDDCLSTFVEEVLPLAVLLHSVFSVAVFYAAPAPAAFGGDAATAYGGGMVPCIAAPIVGLAINVVLFIFFAIWRELMKDDEVAQVCLCVCGGGGGGACACVCA